MRFCPFCSAENADDLAVCQSCGRRLPPLPPRRARNAPATGVLLPPRAATTTQPPPVTAPRRSGSTNPPPNAAQPSVTATSAGLVPVAAGPSGMRAPASPAVPGVAPSGRDAPAGSSPAIAPPQPPSASMTMATAATMAAPIVSSGATAAAPPMVRGDGSFSGSGPGIHPRNEAARALATALSPGPAAQRREPPPSEPADPSGNARRRSDLSSAQPHHLSAQGPPQVPPQPRAVPSVLTGPRSAPAVLSSQPPMTNPALIAAAAATLTPSHAADPPWATARAPLAASAPAATAAGPAVASPVGADTPRRGDDGVEPPPTRIHRPEALVDRPFTPPQVSPVPEIPEPGLVTSARYALRFARARWQRRGAIKMLGSDIKKDTDALDQVLGALGGVARTAKVDGRVFSGENAAITAAEQRAAQITKEHNDVDVRKLDESSRFVDVERERNAKLGEAERMVDEAQKELAQLEAQRRGLRDKRKELERRQKTYLKAAADNDKQTTSTEQGDTRQELRRAAEQHRREAAALEPERQDIDRRVTALERPIGEATAKLDAAKAELDAAKRSLSDAREGHVHRLAELDAEQKRKAREIAQAEAEIARRLVTLGTLVNLNRIEDPQFGELYQRIDRLRGAITARTTEIEKLTAEREAYDRGTLVRGIATIGGAILLFIALIVILRAAVLH